MIFLPALKGHLRLHQSAIYILAICGSKYKHLEICLKSGSPRSREAGCPAILSMGGEMKSILFGLLLCFSTPVFADSLEVGTNTFSGSVYNQGCDGCGGRPREVVEFDLPQSLQIMSWTISISNVQYDLPYVSVDSDLWSSGWHISGPFQAYVVYDDEWIDMSHVDTDQSGRDGLWEILPERTSEIVPFLTNAYAGSGWTEIPFRALPGEFAIDFIGGANDPLISPNHEFLSYDYSMAVEVETVPEPATLFLFSTGLGVICLAVWRRRG
jgi:hypothetical protein